MRLQSADVGARICRALREGMGTFGRRTFIKGAAPGLAGVGLSTAFGQAFPGIRDTGGAVALPRTRAKPAEPDLDGGRAVVA